MSEFDVRRDIVEVCRRMYDRHLIAGLDGNVSARTGRHVVTTPRGMNKGYLKPEDLVVVELDGRLRRKGGRDRSRLQSSEVALHLKVYGLRPDVGAVVHAHPPIAIARTIAKLDVVVPAIPEAVVYLGPVPTAPYATPGTQDLPASIESILFDRCINVLMLERHGSLTLGTDVFDAFNRLDALEHTARLMGEAEKLGSVVPLPAAEIERLRSLYGETVPLQSSLRRRWR